ncbi:mitochondrial thiamine pyrophosphate carrier-like [Leptidea sinapis]|uniref:Mitochondrial thiamine pyrophosphate carrier n=1 Tax=Leptidea sinapis TaxID=189913 RepID=A0A5E4QF42_9NEOP|nr:mitochondrial thiamine pyrophosphate carrier-like [Leptidea sinapis]VVC96324.1 unnamed protein product [Leptidea sinapis]
MVQNIQEMKSKITISQSALAGGIAGAVTRLIAQPLDVLKIRFQLQLEPIKSGSKYSSITQAVVSIIKEEGITTLWSGHIPAQLLSISFGIVQFSLYEKMTQLCQTSDQYFYNTHKHYLNFSNGAIAATAATIISFPFDTVRTRLIAEQKTNRAYSGFIDAFSSMVKCEGPAALFKGLVPTVAQIAPHAGIQFAVYKLFTENIFLKIDFFQRPTTLGGTIEASLIANVLAGSIAGFVSKTMIYPFDVVKKRLQIQGFQEHRKAFGRQMYCKGSIHCIWLTITKEGFLALYKGLGPSIVKAIIVSALHFTVYDEIKNQLIRK